MKYYLDTEFLEGTQKKFFGKTKPTIDLISIGLVAEDGREYCAISKDFNLKEAWNRYDLEMQSGDMRNLFPEGKKIYWIRENVLKPIYEELVLKDNNISSTSIVIINGKRFSEYNFCFTEFKRLIKKYGKSNKEIASEILNFINPDFGFHISSYNNSELKAGGRLDKHFNDHNVKDFDGYFYAQPEFYTYYGAYDWVVFCWLFGKMIDLPKGFPMYSKDLKQIYDEKEKIQLEGYKHLKENSPKLKQHVDYPKQSKEHNALADAKWNLELHKFLQSIT